MELDCIFADLNDGRPAGQLRTHRDGLGVLKTDRVEGSQGSALLTSLVHQLTGWNKWHLNPCFGLNVSGQGGAQWLSQQVTMGGSESIAQCPDLIEGQGGRSVRVDHGRIANEHWITGHSSLHRQLTHTDE